MAEHIIVSDSDLQRLRAVLDLHPSRTSEDLDAELYRAQIVPEVPADVVSMNRDVEYEDLETRERRRVRVVFPQDADLKRGFVSVLAPIGSALLGLRVGQSIEWAMPRGRKRVRVVAVA